MSVSSDFFALADDLLSSGHSQVAALAYAKAHAVSYLETSGTYHRVDRELSNSSFYGWPLGDDNFCRCSIGLNPVGGIRLAVSPEVNSSGFSRWELQSWGGNLRPASALRNSALLDWEFLSWGITQDACLLAYCLKYHAGLSVDCNVVQVFSEAMSLPPATVLAYGLDVSGVLR